MSQVSQSCPRCAGKGEVVTVLSPVIWALVCVLFIGLAVQGIKENLEKPTASGVEFTIVFIGLSIGMIWNLWRCGLSDTCRRCKGTGSLPRSADEDAGTLDEVDDGEGDWIVIEHRCRSCGHDLSPAPFAENCPECDSRIMSGPGVRRKPTLKQVLLLQLAVVAVFVITVGGAAAIRGEYGIGLGFGFFWCLGGVVLGIHLLTAEARDLRTWNPILRHRRLSRVLGAALCVLSLAGAILAAYLVFA